LFHQQDVNNTIFNKELDYLMKFICNNLVLNLLINLQFLRQATMVHKTMLFTSVLDGPGEKGPTSSVGPTLGYNTIWE